MKRSSKKSQSIVWIISCVAIIVIFIIIGSASGNKTPRKESKNNLNQTNGVFGDLADNFYDFGTISMAKGKVTKVFSYKNTTVGKISVKKLFTSCMCTKAILIKGDKKFGPFGMPAHGLIIPEINTDIDPNQEVSIEAIFDPAAHGPAGVGPIERKVILETNNGDIIFKFKANVTP